jgi:essential nuclear protein 1
MSAAVAGSARFRHENPLEKDILATGPLRTKSKKRKAKREDDAEDGYIDSRASRKILKIGQELEEEDRQAREVTKTYDPFAFESRFPEEEEEDFSKYDDDEAWGDEEEEIVEEVVSRNDSVYSIR